MRQTTLMRFLALTLILFVAVACNLLNRARQNDNAGSPAATNANSSGVAQGYVLVSNEGNFTVTLPPGYPAPRRESIYARPRRGNNVPIGDRYASDLTGHGSCLIAYEDLPSASTQGASALEILEREREGILPRRLRGGERVEHITVQGHRGIRIHAGREGAGARYDLILAGTRLYKLGFTTPRNAGEVLFSPEVQSYFDSFRITGDTTAQPARP